jgi:hypothetical protein
VSRIGLPAVVHEEGGVHDRRRGGGGPPPRGRPTRAGWGGRLAGLAGLAAATGYVYLADPDKGGAYPACPSRLLLGVDCPACGGLRGTNALLHGRIAESLDHNALLPLLLGIMAVSAALWLVLPLIGRQPPTRRPPRWLIATTIGILLGFAVVRNLPFSGLEYLASEA